MKRLTLIAIVAVGAVVAAGVIVGIVLGVRAGQKDDIYTFPDEFKFGAASASYQIEGAWDVDGKSPSIWDTATHNNADRIDDGSNGDIACNSYEFYMKDVEALRNIGAQLYRFSIAWPRIIPDGGRVNEKGIEYYSNLIDQLLANGIEPVVTIYHWDLPQYLQDIGGWQSPLIVDHFTYYAEVLFQRFGDRVKRWITFNEIYVFCRQGYSIATKAPLINAHGVGEYYCAHHTLLSHAATYHLYRDKYFQSQQGQIGISIDTNFYYAGYENVTQSVVDQAHLFRLGWIGHPIFSQAGGYPTVMVDEIGRRSIKEGRSWSRLPEMTDEIKQYIRGTADYLAINYYTSSYVAMKDEENDYAEWEADRGVDEWVDPNWPHGKSLWLYSYPQGLHDLLNWIRMNYNNIPVFISENGWSDDGELEDWGRVEYIKVHLAAISKAINDGCKVVGYSVWSIMDNFEWMRGYTEKFGIYFVDMNSAARTRTPKKSAEFYKGVTTDRSFVLN